MFESLSRTGYAIIISLILGTAFLSQQPAARDYGNKLYLGALSQEKVYQAKLMDWAFSKGFIKTSGEQTAGGGTQKDTAVKNTNQNKIFQNIFQK